MESFFINKFKKYGKVIICLFVIFSILIPLTSIHAQDAEANLAAETGIQSGSYDWFSFLYPSKWIKEGSKVIAELLLFIGSAILSLAGLLLNTIIDWTIVKMSANLASGGGGLGDSINNAWSTLRDIANMVFIFVLIWAAIQTILDLNTGKFKTQIRNIIIIALLINFSLFFTKIVIDAGNIATVGFYNAIIASAGQPYTIPGVGIQMGDFTGIFARLTEIQTFYSQDVVSAAGEGFKLLVTGVMGLVTMGIMSIIFMIVSVMLVARYVILIFIMILSPIAFIAYAIPGLSGKFSEWWKALVNQSFFSAYFMLLMWVAIKILAASTTPYGTGDFSSIASNPQTVMGIVLRFVLVIGFMITALVLSKKMATSTSAGAAFTTAAGGVIAGAGFAGRQTIGRGARAVANNEWLREKSKTSTLARTALWTGNKGQGASFDLRNAPGGKNVTGGLGNAGGKGGFNKAVEDKAKAKAKYAKDVYGQTDNEKKMASDAKKLYEGEDGKGGSKKEYENARKIDASRINNDRNLAVSAAKTEFDAAQEDLKEKNKKAEQLKNDRIGGLINVDPREEEAAVKAAGEAKIKFDTVKIKHEEALAKKAADIEESDYSEAVRALGEKAKEHKEEWDNWRTKGEKRMGAYADRITNGPPRIVSAIAGGVLGSAGGPIGSAAGAYAGYKSGGKIGKFVGSFQGNKAAAAEIRKSSKEKSNEAKFADAAAALAKEQKDAEGGGEPKKEEAKTEPEGEEKT